VGYPDGDVNMAGPDKAGDSFALAACEHVLEEVAWLVEEAGEGHVKARHVELIRALCLLQCTNPLLEEESQN
jgi:hypothetical protein